MTHLWRTLTGRRTSSFVSLNLEAAPNGINGHAPLKRIETAALSSVGCVRQNNEDSISLVCSYGSHQSLTESVLAIVADGMGGAQGGKLASETAVEVISSSFLSYSQAPPIALKNALVSANKAVYDLAQKDPSLEGMGTTAVVLFLTPEQAWVGWVGDSRLYLLRDGRMFQMTEDHSLATELVRGGAMTHEQALRYEDRHVLTRALGTRPDVEAGVWDNSLAVLPGDRFLLCSDGLHDPVPEADVFLLAGLPSVEAAATALINRASEQGGYDNISCILLDVPKKANGKGGEQ